MPRIVTSSYGTFHAWTSDHLSTMIGTGAFWDEQIKVVLDAGDPTGTALDLGANIGFHTVYLAGRYARTLAVEAHPETYKLLVKNIAQNGLESPHVIARSGAAYDRHTTLYLALPPLVGFKIPSETDLDQTPNSPSFAFVPKEKMIRLDAKGLAIPAFPLDDDIERLQQTDGWPPVSCIKVDCQGCDLRALMGLTRTIARDRPQIVFEFEWGVAACHEDTWADHLAFFAAHHYTVTRLHTSVEDHWAHPEEKT